MWTEADRVQAQVKAMQPGTPYPVGIVVDLDVGVLVHGREGHAVFQLIRQDPSVHHVVAKGVEQLDVDVAHQGVQHFLEGGSGSPLGGCRPHVQDMGPCYLGKVLLKPQRPQASILSRTPPQ